MTIPPAGGDSYRPTPEWLAPPRRAVERLFTPGPRLGWVFRDRRALASAYLEPEPDSEAIRKQAAARAAAAERRYVLARKWAGMPSLMLAVVLLVLAGCAKAINGATDTGATFVSMVILCGPGVGFMAWCRHRREQAANVDPDQQYRQARGAWQQREAVHLGAELARLEQVPEWGSAGSPTRRTDVFGGSLAGWQALLTTHGTSILAAQPLLVVDLSGQYAAAELTAIAQDAGVQTAEWTLPGDMDRCGMLARLNPSQLADAVTEAIHAGSPGGARAERAVDVHVLEQLAAALDDVVTPAKLAAAARVALGHPVSPGMLSPREHELIGGDLFPADYRSQIGMNLVRLDAFLSDLARYSGAGRPVSPAPAYYTCLAVEPAARSARGEMLAALAIQWLTVQVSGCSASVPAVIIAAADEITRPHLERLADACEHRRVPLTVLYRHLRADALAMLGGGAAAFMRLGNHAEAEQAASYIGRQHTFVLSQLTASFGGSQTTTRTETEGYGVTDSVNLARTRGWQEDHSGHRGSSGGMTRSRGLAESRNWSTAMSWADGTSWNDAKTTQRVYEYAVEPTVLQALPDNALLLAARGARGVRGVPGAGGVPGANLMALECDPAIVTLPGVSAAPLASVPRYAQIEAPAPRWPAPPGDREPQPVRRAPHSHRRRP